MKTNVKIGNYPGWRPKISSSKQLLPPKSNTNLSTLNKNQSSDMMLFTPTASLVGKVPSLAQSNNVNAPGLIWNDESASEMFKTTNQQFHEDPLSKFNFSDFMPEVDDKRNKKNESCLNFAHRIDLKILNSID